MNTPNERPEIEAVLRGLSAVEAPMHLGQEVARELSQSLQRRSAIPQRRHPWAFLRHPATLGGSCAALIALVLITYFFVRTSNSIERLPGQDKVERATLPAAPKSLSKTFSSAQGYSEVRTKRGSQLRQRKAALVQAVAISHPAPASPLTEQERLLIRVAQGRDPVQLASLNVELQDAMDTARRDNFIKLSNGGSR